MSYGIYSDFDILQHKATFTNYLEVIIDVDGKVMYAVPSHLQKAIRLACDKLKITEEQLSDNCPPDQYYNWINWVLTQSGAIAVWNEAFAGPLPNRKQQAALRRLKQAGLYRGPITKPNW